MQPILKNGDIVLVSNLLYLFKEPQINDIVAFKFNNKIVVKRISQIKDKQYFLMGDNLNDSLDSRKIGFISRKNILGKVFKII